MPKRISAYRVAVNDFHRHEIFTTKSLLPSEVAGAVRDAREDYPENYIFVYKIEVDKSETEVAIVDLGKDTFVERFEHYTVLPDNRVQIRCEFGTWIYGGTWNKPEINQSRAQGVVSQMRHTQYWKTISPFDVSREQD
jgi:hypothetical protein